MLRMILILLVVLSAVATFIVWVVPTPVVQSWMMQRASADRYAQYAAFEQAVALWFCLRILVPAIMLLSVAGVYFSGCVETFLFQCGKTAYEQTAVEYKGKSELKRTVLFRLFLLSWLGLGLFHFADGLWQRIEDWPWYHFSAGPEIMPNISDANRDVIRYLQEMTEEDSRILVLSDQKLFFLSYYLLPRRLFHVIHPESEFVIPKANQERQLAAYRFEDLDGKTVAEISPDYILEYFEGKRYLKKDEFQSDPFWIQFQRRRYGPTYEPTYNVRLRRYASGHHSPK